MRFLKPTLEELAGLKDEALASQDEAAFAAKMLGSVAATLRAKPLQYRSYGPYWWPLKQHLIAAGYDEFGEHVDAEWAADAGYGDRTLDLLASWAYQDTRFAQHAIFVSEHILEAPDGDQIPFVSADDTLEWRDSLAG